MNIIQGYAYHIKDSYFDLAQDKYLLQNKESGHYRPFSCSEYVSCK